MQGSIELPFSVLFKDTVDTHGTDWAKKHYMKNGMPEWEFQFWLAATR